MLAQHLTLTVILTGALALQNAAAPPPTSYVNLKHPAVMLYDTN